MTREPSDQAFRRLLDKSEIQDVLHAYARGVDRLDVGLIRSAFHEDAMDDHGDYQGSVDGFVNWLTKRHAKSQSSMHFVSNCYIEFFSNDVALVETYFASRRVRGGAAQPTAAEARFDEKLGRYIDRFERRRGQWRIARRLVVFDARFSTTVDLEPRKPPFTWGERNDSDAFATLRAELLSSYERPIPSAS